MFSCPELSVSSCPETYTHFDFTKNTGDMQMWIPHFLLPILAQHFHGVAESLLGIVFTVITSEHKTDVIICGCFSPPQLNALMSWLPTLLHKHWEHRK